MTSRTETENTRTFHRRLLERLGATVGRFLARARAAFRAVLLALVAGWRAWRVSRGSEPGFTVEVLIADRRRARSVERELNAGLCRLRRALGPDFLGADCTAAVVVQRAITGERSVAGTCHLWRDPQGRRRVLMRLALEFGDWQPHVDDLLAVLTEQVVLLATQHAGATSLVFPVAPPPAQTGGDKPSATTALSALVPIAVPIGLSGDGHLSTATPTGNGHLATGPKAPTSWPV